MRPNGCMRDEKKNDKKKKRGISMSAAEDRLAFLKGKYKEEKSKKYEWIKPEKDNVYKMTIISRRAVDTSNSKYPEVDQTRYVFGKKGDKAFSLSGIARENMNKILDEAGLENDKVGVTIEWAIVENESKKGRTYKDIAGVVHGTKKLTPDTDDDE